MTVYTLTSPMPEQVIAPGMLLKLEAISPTTGAAITGVTCSAWAIYGEDANEPLELDEPVTPGPYMLVPGPSSSETPE